MRITMGEHFCSTCTDNEPCEKHKLLRLHKHAVRSRELHIRASRANRARRATPLNKRTP